MNPETLSATEDCNSLPWVVLELSTHSCRRLLLSKVKHPAMYLGALNNLRALQMFKKATCMDDTHAFRHNR